MWFLLSLVSAFSDANKNVLAKLNTRHFPSIVVTWAWTTFSLIILIPVMFFGGIPYLSSLFWAAFSLRIVLDVISLVLYVEAIKLSDLSLTLPMLTLSPIFLIFSGLLINQELPGPLGLLGVLCIVGGAYLLNLKKDTTHWLEPVQTLINDRGTLLMLVVAMIWGVTGSLHKYAINLTNPFFYTGFGAITLSIIFTVWSLWKYPQDMKRALQKEHLLKIIPIGLFDGVTTLTQFMAQSMSLTVFVIAVKRTSILFSSVLGWLLFKEPVKQRLFPIGLMIVGVALISLS